MYQVFLSAQSQPHFQEGDLVPFVQEEKATGTLDDLLRHLLLFKLRNPLSDTLYSLHASRTKFEVYQFRPALKFLGNPDQRLLIADEVGLGKTIEAGIIFLEMQARLNDIARVLIICPSGLRAKWQDEFRSRFDETFNILDTSGLRKFFDDYRRFGEAARLRGIVSLELLRREEFAEALGRDQVHFDLVIVDEAHHLRNPSTLANAVATVLSDNADAMLLLSATPLQLGIQDLFHLLAILSPTDFDNEQAFGHILEPNRHINRAAQMLATGKVEGVLTELKKVESTSMRDRFLKNPYYAEVIQRLGNSTFTNRDRALCEKHMLEMNTLAHVFTRARKRDVQEKPPSRHALALKVSFSPAERQFYDSVINHVRHEFNYAGGGSWASAFAVIMRERQAASCISAVRDHFTKLAQGTWRPSTEDENAVQGIVDDDETASLSNPVQSFQQLLKIAKSLGNRDSKFDVFFKSLKHLLDENPSTKILVFSFFRGTLEYLYERLRGHGFGVRTIHGGIAVPVRQVIVEEFRDDPRVNILLSSEVGSEGLDFQFCDTLFNYDLPWNPMRVEQRIGRIDRFGQKSPVVRIYNLIIEDSIEERIFYRLYERINIFKESIGDIEAILGEEIRSLSKQIFSARLTPKEEIDLANHAAISILKKKIALEEFESQRLQFMGQDAIFSEQVEQAIESGRLVSEAEIRALVKTFLDAKFPTSRLDRNGDGDYTYCFEPDINLKTHLQNFVLNKRVPDQTAQEFLRRLNARDMMPMTFSAGLAYERKLLEFVTLRHPLARAAAEYWKNQPIPELPLMNITVSSKSPHKGRFHFFVFAFESDGIRKETTLDSVVISIPDCHIVPELGETLLRLLQQDDQTHPTGQTEFDSEQFDAAKKIATQYAAEELDRRKHELERLNAALVSARASAIEQTYQIKHAKVTSYIQNATEPRIRRMREGQLKRIKANYDQAIQDIQGKKKVKMTFSPVLGGILHITNQNG